MKRGAPPFAFMFLHTSLAWPAAVVALALGNGLVRAGVPVHLAAHVIAFTSLAFTFEFAWAPLVDGSLTRRTWFVVGSIAMCASLAALLIAPWKVGDVPILTFLAFASCSGAAIMGVAAKGIMAYDVDEAHLGRATGYYTAGGALARSLGGAGTLWLVMHLATRSAAAAISVGGAAASAAVIVLAGSGPSAPASQLPARMLGALRELWMYLRTPAGCLVAALCVLPFGVGTEVGLMGAIAHEWRVTSDQLATFTMAGAVSAIAGAAFFGWLATRFGPWRAFVLQGWIMVAGVVCFALAPRTRLVFFAVELPYRALAAGCYAALLALIMMSIDKGAASTKAAVMWSLANFAFFYPTLIDGSVHDRLGTTAMLLGDAALGATGFLLILAVRRGLRARPLELAASAALAAD